MAKLDYVGLKGFGPDLNWGKMGLNWDEIR